MAAAAAAAAAAGAGAGAGASSWSKQREEEDDDVWYDKSGSDWIRNEDRADDDAAAGEEEIKDANDDNDVSTLAKGGIKSWARPPLPATFDPAKDAVAMQQVETDYALGMSPPALTRAPYTPDDQKLVTDQRSAIVRIFGCTENGNSACFHVHGFQPYFYIPCWKGFVPHEDVRAIGDAVDKRLREECKREKLRRYVMDVRLVKTQSLWGYHFGELTDFVKITLALPNLIPTVRGWFGRDKGMEIGGVKRTCTTYESNLLYILRFMANKKAVGAGWLELKAGTYLVRPPDAKITRCQLEIDVHADHVVAHEPTGEWMKIAPLRILSTDIECAGRRGAFPTPDKDPVIQIGNNVAVYGQKELIARNVFTFKECAPIPGAQVIVDETESKMLAAWKEFVLAIDPDIITGYNVANFDLPYLLDRARHLATGSSTGFGSNAGKRKTPASSARDTFPFLGRVRGSMTTIKETTFQSKAFGKRTDKEVKLDGRILMDVLQVVRREHKLRSYTLNAVCEWFLDMKKEDVHHSEITGLFSGPGATPETRRRLAVYCIKDALLPLLLSDKLMLVVNFCEMARVTGVTIPMLITRGQQVKVMQQLYRKCAQMNLIIPVRDRAPSDDKYDGATVLMPKCAFYDVPIATLDFASLYPSIMMAHNLCYTTNLTREQADRLGKGKYTVTPTGDLFVNRDIQKGVLPLILEELIAARSNAKKLMKTEKDPFKEAVLNGRQLALKISANSVYGFTGATIGQLPLLAISTSVTGFGRQMIEHTKKRVEETYTIANGYAHNADVIYGDTDSVMVKFGVGTVKEALELGKLAAALVSKDFVPPIKLEFEKVYSPYLLMNKKRYAGLYWTNDVAYDKVDVKGLEIVRRDNCKLVGQVMTYSLDRILIDRSPERAVQYCKSVIADLHQGRIDLSLLVISKQLSKSASSEGYAAKQAHVELAERMRKRDPNTAPVVGDRVAYVMIKAGKGAKGFEKSEDPLFVLQHGIPIDTAYYIENQLRKPLERLFEPMLKNVNSLFAGDHASKIKLHTNRAGAMTRFTVKTNTCMACKTPLKNPTTVTCADCRGKEGEVYLEHVARVREHEQQFARAWTQCQRCQGSVTQDVLCASRDCDNFYRRKKATKDLAEAQAALDRFSF
jgi:DNA polymerase delta subunit 1